MWRAFFWGAVATSSLVLGGLIACGFTLSRRTLGLLMGFGAGTLISAVSYELVFEALRRSHGSGVPAIGFFAGALCFYLSDRWIGALAAQPTNLAIPMVLGVILDGLPESLVIGLGLLEHKAVSLAMLLAILLSNLPEAVAGTVGMQESGWSHRRILLLWLLIAFTCAAASAIGFRVFSGASQTWLSLIQAFAGGAILVMLANSMIPESYEHGGKLTGLFTVFGFFTSVSIVVYELSQAAHG
jgi:ZIP family zinc transporter